MTVVSFARAGDDNQPSPSLWFDCPKERLINEGNGFFFHEEFLGGVSTATATAATPVGNGHMSFDGDIASVISFKTGEVGGFVDLETDGDNNDAAAFLTQPFAKISRDSGLQVWAEVSMELGAIADQGVFVGFVEEAGLTRDVVADNAAGLVGQSLIGFQVLNDATASIDAVAKLDAGAAIEMRAVMNPTPLTANGTFKVGLRFDGERTIYLFFNGVKVGTYLVPGSGFPTGVNMGFIAAIKTGTAAAQSMAFDWIRVAHQSRI